LLPAFVLDFTDIAPFLDAGDSERTGAENLYRLNFGLFTFCKQNERTGEVSKSIF